MEEDFVFLPFFFYFFTWMAVAHIHTSNTKRSFHEISRLYDNKYNTSNYYVDDYVKTHFAETTTTTDFVTAEAATFIKAFEQQPLFSPILFPIFPFYWNSPPFTLLYVFFLLETQNSSSFIVYHVT